MRLGLSAKRIETKRIETIETLKKSADSANGFEFEIINLGDSRTVELKYLISLIEQNLGKKAKIKELPPQPGDVPITFADISKAEKLLDYHPAVDIESGIKKFVQWYREQTVQNSTWARI